MPKRTAVTGDSWEGTYRGDRVEIERDRMRDEWLGAWHYAEGVSLGAGPRKTLPKVLHAIACHADWDLWWKPMAGSPYGTNANVARNVIAARSPAYVLGDWGYVDLRDKADKWLKKDAGSHAYAWWENLSGSEQIDFARDVWLCAYGFDQERDLWEDVAYPGERPLTPAEQRERRAAKKKTKKKRKPGSLESYLRDPPGPRRVRFTPDPSDVEPPRQFGVCRKCHVCLAFDVRQGCCTVCGGPLLKLNPEEVCGLCYEWAFRRQKEHGGTLVHGTVTSPFAGGRTLGHGWVETDDGRVVDWQTTEYGLYDGQDDWETEAFYAVFQPKKTRRYTREQAGRTMLEFSHMGPWHGRGSKPKPQPEWLRRDIEEAEEEYDSALASRLEEIMARRKKTPRSNPAGRYIDTPTFRYQLFVPRKEQPWTGKLPRRVRVTESDHNKPHGAFWTSSLGRQDDDTGTSDWDQWTRNNMPGWGGEGVVLEVGSRANVKHLRTKQEAEDFLTEYGTPGTIALATGEPPQREQDYFGDGEWWGLFQLVPDWKRVGAEFDGLHLEGDALSHPGFYGWDAESTAWFTTKPLSVVETVNLPVYEDEEENPPRRRRKRQRNGKLTRGENARLFRKLMRL